MAWNLRAFWDNARRILQISKKPTAKEYKIMVIITGIGIIVIGLLGFIIQLILVYFGIR
jgi:protein transport protein SEC61 subunit gamma-like protein